MDTVSIVLMLAAAFTHYLISLALYEALQRHGRLCFEHIRTYFLTQE